LDVEKAREIALSVQAQQKDPPAISETFEGELLRIIDNAKGDLP